ncbi:MAG: hypothetical protein CL557_12375 [Alphaproteobacteria bacterium]|nr:hypothetical protein [Alphaproteobacteria bacterium]|tara:strand:+ start:9494 stop:9766 length:273 start_codon:yes stop_codon:yes gene_type:complete
MSDKKEILGSLVDGKVVDFVTEVERIQQLELDARHKEQKSDVSQVKDMIKELEIRVAELEGAQNSVNLDDKYALTKAKLVRLMKEMGYYD